MKLKNRHIALLLFAFAASGLQAQHTPTLPLTTVGRLDSTLAGSSSLFRWNGDYWSANDHGTLALHRIDTATGASLQIVNTGLVVNDLEEITQQGDYIYFGDVGNNMGSRTDLRILRINKDSLLAGHFSVDTIFYSYADQTNFSYNNLETDYDCEAFVVSGDSIYLFTKQWTTKATTCYALPAAPGRHVAQPVGTAPVGGLVTGACLLPELRILLLCGYSETLMPMVYVCYDFQGNRFFSGQQAKANTGSMGLQTEAIASADGYHTYLTNEHFAYGSYIDVPQQLSLVDLSQLLAGYLHLGVDEAVAEQRGAAHPTVYPNPATDRIAVRNLDKLRGIANGSLMQLCDAGGRVISSQQLTDSTIANGLSLSLYGLPAGVYQLRISAAKGRVWTISFVKGK